MARGPAAAAPASPERAPEAGRKQRGFGMNVTDLAVASRSEHPLDVLERLVASQDWAFDREDEDELCVTVGGSWAEYHIAFTWVEEVESLHVACGFDLRAPPRRRAEVMNLISLVNEQLWLGHFDFWSSENVVMYRHGLLLAGGAEPTASQCEALLRAALEACERYYQAFQFVLWAGKPAREALDAVLFETRGEA